MSGAFRLPASLSVGDARRLQAELQDWLADTPSRPVVDGSAVEDLDGAGLQLLIALQRSAGERGLALLNPSPPLARTLRLTGIAGRFDGSQQGDRA